MSIQIKCVLVEVVNFIELVKRYHALLRRVYSIIIGELKNKVITKEIRLQMVIKVVNDIAEYNGLVPTLLVFEIFPRIISDDIFTLSIIERAKTIKMAMSEVAKFHAKR